MEIVPYQPFGDLWVYREIASGGMSVVYLALDPVRARFVALKTLLEELWEEPDHRARFQREIEVQRSLNHPHIVRFLSGEAVAGGCYLATEYLRGRSLDQVLRAHPRGMPIAEVVRILEGLTAALFHAHSKQVVHRDIQPRNIIYEDTGGVKLFDFGIALTSDELVQTKTGTVMGTFAYASPEQNQGRKVDDRSDLYSLGLVVHELLTGQRAIQGTTLLDITEFQLRREIPPPGAFRLEIPEGLSELVARMTQRWPEERPRSARHLLDELIQLKAVATQEERLALEPDEVQAQLDVARRVLHGGRPEQALARAERAEATRPGDGPANLLLGRIHTQLGNLEAADVAFRQAREAFPDSPDVVVDHALALFALRRTRRARTLCEEVQERFGSNALAGCLMAFLDHSEGRSLPPPPPPEPVITADLASLGLGPPEGPAPPPPPPAQPILPTVPPPGQEVDRSASPGVDDPSMSDFELDLAALRASAAEPVPAPGPAPDSAHVSPGSRHGAAPRTDAEPRSTAPKGSTEVGTVRAWQKRMRKSSELLITLAGLALPGMGMLWLGRWGRGLAWLLEALLTALALAALLLHPALRAGEPARLTALAESHPQLLVGWLLAGLALTVRLFQLWQRSRRETARLHAAALSPPIVECAYSRGGFTFLVAHGHPDHVGEDYLVISGGPDPRAHGRYLGDARCLEGGETRSVYRFAPALGEESDLPGAVLLPRYMLGPSELL